MSTSSRLTWRIAIGLFLGGAWEAYGRLIDKTWVSQPTEIGVRLLEWLGEDLHLHVLTTMAEIGFGLSIGVPAGILCGLWLGTAPRVARVARPLIVALYSIPLVTLAPLLIFWFGLDMKPKIVLVAVVSFFLLFFSMFSGVRGVDRDLTSAIALMGGQRDELYTKILIPASVAWILSGLKVAMPYALVAATVGEMLAARQGLGFLLSRSATTFDMAGVYAALVVLMVAGVLIGEAMSAVDRSLLHWRNS